jgi:hypothetical protein
MAMKKPLTYAAILMMGTALTPFTAYAQTADDQVAETDATDPAQDADADDDFDDDDGLDSEDLL